MKALETLIELNKERLNSGFDSAAKGFSIRMIEVLFKIPDHNEPDLPGEEQQEIMESYFKKNFPDYELFLSVIHKDELVEHYHGFIDGKNSETGLYDFPQAQYEYIRNKLNLTDFPEKNTECSNEQLRIIGEKLQTDFYDHANEYLQKIESIIVFKKKDLTDDEREYRRKIKIESSKPLADRQYNLATKLKKSIAELVIQKTFLSKSVSDIIEHGVEYISSIFKGLSDEKLKEKANKINSNVQYDPIHKKLIEEEISLGKDHLQKSLEKKQKRTITRPK